MFKYLIIAILLVSSLYAKSGYIEATGYGNTKKEALKSAFSDAVSQYIGVVVDSKSVTKNGKLIEDKILTFSNGYIKKYTVISSKQKVGLWQISINALVKEQDVMDKIIKEKISSKNIKNSNQRYAKLVSQIKTKFEAEDMFVATMKGLLSWDTMKKYNRPKITKFFIDEDGATRKYVPVTIKVIRSLNKLAYNNTLNEFKTFLKKLGGKRYVKNELKDKFTAIKIYNADGVKNEYWKFPNSYKVIYPFISQGHYGTSWYEYLKDGEDSTTVAKSGYFDKHYNINFLDKKGNILKTVKNKITLSTDYWDNIFDRYVTVSPFDNNGNQMYNKIVKVPLNLIKDLARVEVKWVD